MKNHEKIMKIMKNHENHENHEKQKISKKFRKNLKNQKKNQKVQNFSHSIWKVPKMFCHLEIHWGALGRRNIDHEQCSQYFLRN